MADQEKSTRVEMPEIDQGRRKFFKTAIAGAFAAPLITSAAVDHFTNKAQAQVQYTAPEVLSVERSASAEEVSVASFASASAIGTQSTSAMWTVIFNQPIDLSTCSGDPCSGGSFRGDDPNDDAYPGDGSCEQRGSSKRTTGMGLDPAWLWSSGGTGEWSHNNTRCTQYVDETHISSSRQASWGAADYYGTCNFRFFLNEVDGDCVKNKFVKGTNGLAAKNFVSQCFELAGMAPPSP